MDKLDRLGTIVDKGLKIYIIIEIFLMVLMVIAGYILKMSTIVDIFYCLGMCVAIIMQIIFLIGVFTCVIILVKNGYHNISKCDDELFERIDRYKCCWDKSDAYYKRLMQIINLKYKANGVVDTLVHEKNIARLYKRMDFLKGKNLSSKKVLIDVCKNIVVPTVVSFLQLIGIIDMEFLSPYMIINTILGILRIIFQFFIGKISKQNNEYEIKLLQEKIDIVERSLTITEQDEKILQTQQTVIELLIKKRKKSKSKQEQKELENSLEAIDKLNLCIHDYSDSYIREINIYGQTGYLVYDLEKGKENNYIGELNLKTQEFSKLYKILDQYKWISYLETTDYRIK